MPPMGGHGKRYMAPGEKADMRSLGKLFKFMKRDMPFVVIAIACGIAGAMASIIGPEKISELMNIITASLMKGIDIGSVGEIAITLVIIYAVGATLNYLQQFIMATVTQKTTRRLRTNINLKINKLPLSYFDRTSKGDILSRVTNDVDIISQTLAQSTANLIGALALFAGVTVKMFGSNWLLALVTIGSSVIGFIFMSVIMKKSQKYFNRKQVHLGEMNGQVEEVYTNHKIVKSFGAKEKENEIFSKTNDKLFESNWKSQWLSGMMMPMMGFVGNLAYALIFIVGVSLIVAGSSAVTLGTIIAFVIYAKMFSQPLTIISQAMVSVQQASAASKRVFEFLGEEEMPSEDGKTKTLESGKIKGDVEFDHVRFGYTPDKVIIHDFSVSLKAGQKVAIVGPTGAGKTTIVNLLMRFYDLNQGDIRIDGVSIMDMQREKVHDLFDMILQDTWLFDGTIRENLIYNKEGVTDEDLDRVCKAVGLEHFVSTLPERYDTVINEALNLSAGQKQQLTIARAMIKDSPLLILDEATSSVDTRTELVIQKAMDSLSTGRTAFVIAHRLSTIKNADIILVMKDGDIIEQGTHEELLAKDGFYAELYNSQFAAA